MNLEHVFDKGKIAIEEFARFEEANARRNTSILRPGDYAVLTNPADSSLLLIERIASLTENGDFTTEKGTTGPIDGNIFMKRDLRNQFRYLIIEGDNVTRKNSDVYRLVDKHLGKED